MEGTGRGPCLTTLKRRKNKTLQGSTHSGSVAGIGVQYGIHGLYLLTITTQGLKKFGKLYNIGIFPSLAQVGSHA